LKLNKRQALQMRKRVLVVIVSYYKFLLVFGKISKAVILPLCYCLKIAII